MAHVAIFKDGIIRHTAVIPMGGNIITEDIKEGCAILGRQAEMLKVEFGSAWPGENRDNEIVSIPGIKGKEPKEITLKNLSKIIHSRVSEIITLVFNAIKSYGHEEHKKKLIAGIVLTGGGSQLKHIVQLVEYITGMDTRIGYPNEHLANNSEVKVTSPIYATSIGLVMSAIDFEAEEIIRQKMEEIREVEKATELEKINAIAPPDSNNKGIFEDDDPEPEIKEKTKTSKPRGFFERFSNKIKEILDSSDE